jgi:hypothetical protein
MLLIDCPPILLRNHSLAFLPYDARVRIRVQLFDCHALLRAMKHNATLLTIKVLPWTC